ncbi:histidine phosphatase superfamily [Bipolaris maydis]|nr:histidine phosphatase superfamily [Bipolaris maydis]
MKLLALALAASSTAAAAQQDFNIFQHIGGNAQWYPGEETTGISSEVPEGCKVDLAAFFSRHGSRYPDRGAYNGWVEFSKYIQAAGNFTVTNPKLAFLKTWRPVLSNPEAQIANLSPTGWKELHEMGTTWRLRYPDLYEYNTPFTMWSNYYTSGPRVRDSARLFAQGFVGPNATDLTTIYALNASNPTSWGNSLAPSDLCKAYNDDEGSPFKPVWDSIYLTPIAARLNSQIQGGLNLTNSQVDQIPYLCGFETQITGRLSPFCDILTEEEILQYEYAQDLRYWYGTGLGSAAMIGVFDSQPPLPANVSLSDRLFRSSQVVKMRGTVAFERLFCATTAPSSTYRHHERRNGTNVNDVYMRIRINEVVYPYQQIIQKKRAEAGDVTKMCNMTDTNLASQPKATFFFDNTLPWQVVVKA